MIVKQLQLAGLSFPRSDNQQPQSQLAVLRKKTLVGAEQISPTDRVHGIETKIRHLARIKRLIYHTQG